MKRTSRGFTLIELMIGLTILAVVLALAVPSFRQFTQNNAVVAAHNDLVTSIQLARSEALRRNRPVSICASVDGEDCATDTDWDSGWIAFIDRGVAGELDHADDEVLQRWQPQNSNLAFVSEEESHFIQFQPTGMANDEANIEVFWEGCSGERRRHLTVLITGAVSSQLEAC